MDSAADTVTALCADPGSAGLLLDFDGVLAPIVADPTTSRLLDGTADALERIARHLRLVAVVSGRPLHFLTDRAAVPGLRLLGSYGVEEIRDGVLWRHPEVVPWLPAVQEATRTLQSAMTDLPGVRVEEKGVSVAVHWRQALDPASAQPRIEQVVAEIADHTGLRREPGKLVEELRAPVSVDKGTAVAGLIAAGDLRAVVYAGDDLGDLPAFRATVDHGGWALLVDHGPETSDRLREVASQTVPGVTAFAAWLAQLAGELESGV